MPVSRIYDRVSRKGVRIRVVYCDVNVSSRYYADFSWNRIEDTEYDVDDGSRAIHQYAVGQL